jgi:hypothetical protein
LITKRLSWMTVYAASILLLLVGLLTWDAPQQQSREMQSIPPQNNEAPRRLLGESHIGSRHVVESAKGGRG